MKIYPANLAMNGHTMYEVDEHTGGLFILP